MHTVPADDIPKPESIIPVVEVWHILQSTLSNVIWYTEGAVGHRGHGSPQDCDHTLSTRCCILGIIHICEENSQRGIL